MFDLLWLVPALPFIGFVLLALFGGRLSRNSAAGIGVGSVGISAILTLFIGFTFIQAPPESATYTQVLWKWVAVKSFTPSIALHLDALSLVFIFVITFVGFFIHLYSSRFMWEEEGYSRFFAYMNLFVGSMLTLVLADNLLLLYLGWEGVGLCSYLLIGFWYKDSANGYAARKAFIVTRVGDTAMAIGLFLLFTHFSTLHIQTLLDQASAQWTIHSTSATLVAALLLGGAVGKSAQLPLQTWLPDAMAGPTPVSALIHAATMVTAGVYLIARTNVFFTLAPAVQTAVAVLGAFTLLIAGFTALTQRDIKRVLAYSTISQIGYMFLALGVGAWSAAVFHFMTHAFFKALLFLAAGVIILVLHHEHDMFKMGGLRRKLPVTFWTFLIGSASLAALPLITAGFYSKDLILWFAFASPMGSKWLWAAGLLGAFITAIYTFRMVFVTFFGTAQTKVSHKPSRLLQIPLIVLAVFALIAGFVELPHTLGHLTLFSGLMQSVLPESTIHNAGVSTELVLQLIAAAVTLIGILIAYYVYIKRRALADQIAKSGIGAGLHRFWFSGWGFDWLYDRLFVIPLVWFAQINRSDFIDFIYNGIASTTQIFHEQLSLTQTGKLRWYAMGILLGAVITLTVVVYL